ncbi:MAG: hypothetical protein CMO81_07805 [Waddliaceae bacterium]|nr:hypothetical protein [Waddliaceae bacterium]
MHIDLIREQVENRSGLPLDLRFNENHSTLISVKREQGFLKASVHKMFLEAPTPVVEALIRYLSNRNKRMSSVLRRYIADAYKDLDYSHRVDPTKIITSGQVHDLEAIYNAVNQEYFNEKLNLRVTWYGRPVLSKGQRITFGLYCDPLRLIKIHRLLDRDLCPEYVISFIVYHEALHHVHPPFVDKQGKSRIHNSQFKEKEEAFKYFSEASAWLKDNWDLFFHAA